MGIVRGHMRRAFVSLVNVTVTQVVTAEDLSQAKASLTDSFSEVGVFE